MNLKSLFAFLAPLATAFFLIALPTACTTDPTETSDTTDVADTSDVVDSSGTLVASDTTVSDVHWSSSATTFRGQDNRRIAYDCPADGFASVVWGTDVYTDDSSVCTAAVHKGKITLADGGRVIIEIRPAQESYEGTDRNGITTRDYGSWNGSYVFP